MLRFLRLYKNISFFYRYPSVVTFSVLIFLLFFLPVILLVSGLVPLSLRWVCLAGVFCISMFIALRHGYSARELGIQMAYLKQSLEANAFFVLLSAALFFFLSGYGLIETDADHPRALFFVFYILISSPLQEFLFRSFLFAEMNRAGIKQPSVQIFVSAAVFSFIHIIYFDVTTALATFAAGIVLAAIYRKYPNLAGVSLAHAAIGTMAIIAGIARTTA